MRIDRDACPTGTYDPVPERMDPSSAYRPAPEGVTTGPVWPTDVHTLRHRAAEDRAAGRGAWTPVR